MDMSSSSDESPDPMKSSSRSSSKAKSKSSSSSSGTIISPKGRITKSTLSAHTLNILKPGYLESRRELLVEPPEEAADDCFLSLFGREAMTKGTKKRRKVEESVSAGREISANNANLDPEAQAFYRYELFKSHIDKRAYK